MFLLRKPSVLFAFLEMRFSLIMLMSSHDRTNTLSKFKQIDKRKLPFQYQ